MPPNTVFVGRPSKWGNPITVASCYFPGKNTLTDARRKAVEKFKEHIQGENLDDLRGKDLACWCKDGEPCHADVLLEMANR